MAYRTPRTNWVAGEMVTAEDLIRIEENAEASAKHGYTQFAHTGLGVVISTTPVVPAGTSAVHVSRTGKIRISCMVTFVTMIGGTAQQYNLYFAANGANIIGAQAVVAVSSLTYVTLYFDFIYSMTPNVGVTYGPMVNVSGVNGAQVNRVIWNVVDI